MVKMFGVQTFSYMHLPLKPFLTVPSLCYATAIVIYTSC
jgi:hypothetical protein